MKKILLFFVLGVLLASCSGKLTTSKAEKLIEEKLKQNPVERYVTLKTGDSIEFYVSNGNKEKIEAYESLQKEGFIEMSLVEEYESYYPNSMDYIYSIHLTDKGKKCVKNTQKSSDGKYTENTVMSCSATLDKVDEIYLAPNINMAEATATFKIEKTPFVVLEEDKYLFKNDISSGVKIGFQKGEKNGWQIMGGWQVIGVKVWNIY